MTRNTHAGLAVLVAGAFAVPVLVAEAATAGHYSGQTSQGNTISFSLSGGAVTGLDFRLNDKCPDGHILHVHASHFRPLPVDSKGHFGGTFGSASQPTVISGKVGSKKVTGTLSDTSRSQRTGQACHATGVHFSAHHV